MGTYEDEEFIAKKEILQVVEKEAKLLMWFEIMTM